MDKDRLSLVDIPDGRKKLDLARGVAGFLLATNLLLTGCSNLGRNNNIEDGYYDSPASQLSQSEFDNLVLLDGPFLFSEEMLPPSYELVESYEIVTKDGVKSTVTLHQADRDDYFNSIVFVDGKVRAIGDYLGDPERQVEIDLLTSTEEVEKAFSDRGIKILDPEQMREKFNNGEAVFYIYRDRSQCENGRFYDVLFSDYQGTGPGSYQGKIDSCN